MGNRVIVRSQQSSSTPNTPIDQNEIQLSPNNHQDKNRRIGSIKESSSRRSSSLQVSSPPPVVIDFENKRRVTESDGFALKNESSSGDDDEEEDEDMLVVNQGWMRNHRVVRPILGVDVGNEMMVASSLPEPSRPLSWQVSEATTRLPSQEEEPSVLEVVPSCSGTLFVPAVVPPLDTVSIVVEETSPNNLGDKTHRSIITTNGTHLSNDDDDMSGTLSDRSDSNEQQLPPTPIDVSLPSSALLVVTLGQTDDLKQRNRETGMARLTTAAQQLGPLIRVDSGTPTPPISIDTPPESYWSRVLDTTMSNADKTNSSNASTRFSVSNNTTTEDCLQSGYSDENNLDRNDSITSFSAPAFSYLSLNNMSENIMDNYISGLVSESNQTLNQVMNLHHKKLDLAIGKPLGIPPAMSIHTRVRSNSLTLPTAEQPKAISHFHTRRKSNSVNSMSTSTPVEQEKVSKKLAVPSPHRSAPSPLHFVSQSSTIYNCDDIIQSPRKPINPAFRKVIPDMYNSIIQRDDSNLMIDLPKINTKVTAKPHLRENSLGLACSVDSSILHLKESIFDDLYSTTLTVGSAVEEDWNRNTGFAGEENVSVPGKVNTNKKKTLQIIYDIPAIPSRNSVVPHSVNKPNLEEKRSKHRTVSSIDLLCDKRLTSPMDNQGSDIKFWDEEEEELEKDRQQKREDLVISRESGGVVTPRKAYRKSSNSSRSGPLKSPLKKLFKF